MKPVVTLAELMWAYSLEQLYCHCQGFFTFYLLVLFTATDITAKFKRKVALVLELHITSAMKREVALCCFQNSYVFPPKMLGNSKKQLCLELLRLCRIKISFIFFPGERMQPVGIWR